MNFDFHSWLATDVENWYSQHHFSDQEQKDLKEQRLPQDCPQVAFISRAAAASTGIAATSVGTFHVLNKDLREARRSAWRNAVRLLDHSEFQKIYDACWDLPEEIEPFPPFSFLIRIRLKLATALLTKDDQEYYAIDNPVRKDRTFGVPYLSASSWKGCFRTALARLDHGPEDKITVRLCGNVRGEEDHAKSRRGRLEFFATPFAGLGFEVLNPHNRTSKTGKPIYYESVPAGTTGDFCLLYVPFDGFAREPGDLNREVCTDLPIVAEALTEMLLVSGFGAKISSGFGTAHEQAPGQMKLRATLAADADSAAVPPTEPLPGYLVAPGRLRPEYLNPDGTFREQDAATMKKSDRHQYVKALKWFEARARGPVQAEVKPKAEPAAVQFAHKTVSTLKDVAAGAREWSSKLEQQG